MIIELLFNVLFGLIDMIVSIIPEFDVSLDLSWISGLSSVFQYIGMFVDISVVLWIISIAILRDNFVLLKNILVAIFNKIPFIN